MHVQMGWRRGLVFSGVAIISLALVACDQKQEQAAPPPPSVKVAQPLQKDVVDWDEYTGRFEASDFVEIRARVSGYLTEVHFKDGQTVEKGDLLFTIDPRPFQRALEQAQAELARSKSERDFAKSDLERAQPLVKQGTVSVQVFEDRRRKQQEAEAGVKSAEARVQSAQLDLDFTSVRAPLKGRLSNRRIDVGNFVSGGGAQSTLLTTLVALDPIFFVFDASEADYLRYVRLSRDGRRPLSRDFANPVQLRLTDETDWKWKGVMNFVDNRLDPNSGTIRGRAVFQNPDFFLTPGTFGRLRLIGSNEYQGLLIPDAAVVSDQARKLVLAVKDDGTVEGKVVTLGPIYDGLRVIRTGLAAEDKIIIDGVQRAKPGAKVTPEQGTIETPKLTSSADEARG